MFISADPNVLLPIGAFFSGAVLLFIISVTVYYIFKLEIVLWLRSTFTVLYMDKGNAACRWHLSTQIKKKKGNGKATPNDPIWEKPTVRLWPSKSHLESSNLQTETQDMRHSAYLFTVKEIKKKKKKPQLCLKSFWYSHWPLHCCVVEHFLALVSKHHVFYCSHHTSTIN